MLSTSKTKLNPHKTLKSRHRRDHPHCPAREERYRKVSQHPKCHTAQDIWPRDRCPTALTTWQSFTIDVNLAQTCRQWSRFFDHRRRFVFNHLVQNVLIYLFIAHIIPDGFINTMILYGLKPPNHISWLNQIIWFLCFHDKKQPDWIKFYLPPKYALAWPLPAPLVPPFPPLPTISRKHHHQPPPPAFVPRGCTSEHTMSFVLSTCDSISAPSPTSLSPNTFLTWLNHPLYWTVVPLFKNISSPLLYIDISHVVFLPDNPSLMRAETLPFISASFTVPSMTAGTQSWPVHDLPLFSWKSLMF